MHVTAWTLIQEKCRLQCSRSHLEPPSGETDLIYGMVVSCMTTGVCRDIIQSLQALHTVWPAAARCSSGRGQHDTNTCGFENLNVRETSLTASNLLFQRYDKTNISADGHYVKVKYPASESLYHVKGHTSHWPKDDI